MFDTICAALESWIPGNRYVLRHAVNATFGWIGVVYAGRLAARLFGPWAGPLGMVLLALSPRYFADSMNNPKDLPFAAMAVAALYYISTVSPKWPYVSPATLVKIVVSLALALNIRVGALLYLGYFGVLMAALLVRERCTDWRRLADTTARVLVVALAMLLLGTLFWPWAGGAPLTRPFQALLGAANYPWDGVVLFMGDEYRAENLPWYYAPWWLLIATPPVVLAGAALSVFFVSNRDDALRRIALWTVVALPVVAGIVMRSTLVRWHPAPGFHLPGARGSRSRRLDGYSARIAASVVAPCRRVGVGHRACERVRVRHPVPPESGRVLQQSGGRSAPGVHVLRHGLLGQLHAPGG